MIRMTRRVLWLDVAASFVTAILAVGLGLITKDAFHAPVEVWYFVTVAVVLVVRIPLRRLFIARFGKSENETTVSTQPPS